MTNSKSVAARGRRSITAIASLSFALLSGVAWAGGTETYQVTGPVLDVSDSVIVIKKGKELWEIARNSETKVTGSLKPGAKVTIQYRMTAVSADVKSPPAVSTASTDRLPKLYPVEKLEKPTEKMAADRPAENGQPGGGLKQAASTESATK